MNGQMQNYKRYTESLSKISQPVLPSQLPRVKMNLSGLSRYAKQKGVTLYELSQTEIRQFVPEREEMLK